MNFKIFSYKNKGSCKGRPCTFIKSVSPIFYSLFLIPFSLFLITFSSCTPTETNTNKKQINFFDTDAFLKQEEIRLRATPHKVSAQISVNGTVEQKILDSLNYTDAFALFFQSSINKTAWKEKYIIDSVIENGNLKKIVYTARNENLKTRRLQVDFNNKQSPENLVFDFKNTSILGDITQKLEYNAKQGIKIFNKQEILLIPNSEMIMEYKF